MRPTLDQNFTWDQESRVLQSWDRDSRQSVTPTQLTQSWVWHENNSAHHNHPPTAANTMSAISQLLLTRFWPIFKGKFLEQQWQHHQHQKHQQQQHKNNNNSNISANSDLILKNFKVRFLGQNKNIIIIVNINNNNTKTTTATNISQLLLNKFWPNLK